MDEVKYKKLFDEALDAFFIADAETGVLIDCNRAACKLVKRNKSELIGQHQKILHPPEENKGDFSKTFKEHIRKSDSQILETKIITKKGEIKNVEIKANISGLKGKKILLGIFRDVTERKKAEQKIMFLSSVVEQSSDGMAIANLEGNLLFVNSAWAKMHGYRSDRELVGQHLKIFHNKEQLEKEVLPFNKKVQECGFNSGEIGHVRKDGKPFLTHMTTNLIKNKEGHPLAIAGIIRDITETKKIEEELRKKNEELETFNKLAIGRELKMVELKKKITELEHKLQNK